MAAVAVPVELPTGPNRSLRASVGLAVQQGQTFAPALRGRCRSLRSAARCGSRHGSMDWWSRGRHRSATASLSHDAQPAGLRSDITSLRRNWSWRCPRPVYTARSRQIQNAPNVMATATSRSTVACGRRRVRGATAVDGSGRRRGDSPLAPISGGAAPRIPLSVWRRPLFPRR